MSDVVGVFLRFVGMVGGAVWMTDCWIISVCFRVFFGLGLDLGVVFSVGVGGGGGGGDGGDGDGERAGVDVGVGTDVVVNK